MPLLSGGGVSQHPPATAGDADPLVGHNQIRYSVIEIKASQQERTLVDCDAASFAVNSAVNRAVALRRSLHVRCRR